jgi:general stress protein YciG
VGNVGSGSSVVSRQLLFPLFYMAKKTTRPAARIGDETRTSRRGFASMDPTQLRRIASKGGKAAQESGGAHNWTKEEAQLAGRKGGTVSRRSPAQPK